MATLDETQVGCYIVTGAGAPSLTINTVGNIVVVVGFAPGGVDIASLAATVGGQAATKLTAVDATTLGFNGGGIYVGYRTLTGTEVGAAGLSDMGGPLAQAVLGLWNYNLAAVPTHVATTGEGGLAAYGDGVDPEDITIAALTGAANRRGHALVWGNTTDIGTTPTLTTPTGWTLGDTDTELSGTNRAVAIACGVDATSNVGATTSTLDNAGGAATLGWPDMVGAVIVNLGIASSEVTGNTPFHSDYRRRRFGATALPYDITTIKE